MTAHRASGALSIEDYPRFSPLPGEARWPHVSKWNEDHWRHWMVQGGASEAAIEKYLRLRDQYGVSMRAPGRGQPLKWVYRPTPKQLQAHLATQPNLLYGGAAGGAKPLEANTPIPTPLGFRPIGSLNVGDIVFGLHGEQVRVVGVGPFLIEPAYRVGFDDGTSLDAGPLHEWLTLTAADRASTKRRTAEYRAWRRATRPKRGTGKKPWLSAMNADRLPAFLDPPLGTIRTTREIAETLTVRGARANHAIPLAGPHDCGNCRTWPIHPYVLGVWLGDGSKKQGIITSNDPCMIEQVRCCGYQVKKLKARYAYAVSGLKASLRSVGVWNNKHVPSDYLVAGEADRLDLLRGLMDTDGSCAVDGQAKFSNTNEKLARAVYALAVSLGVKPFWTEGRAKLNGRDCGPVYNVTWTATLDVFTIPRKRDRLPKTTRDTGRYRYIVSCEPVGPSVVRCIEVEGGMFLAGTNGIPTHNSHWLRWDFHKRALYIPNYTWLILRRTFPELERTHMRDALREQALIGGKLVDTEFRYPNGSLGEFGHCSDEAALARWLSSEYDCIGIDEAATFPRDWLLEIFTRARTTKDGIVAMTRATSNPGGAHTRYLVDRYIDHTVEYDEDPFYEATEFGYIPAKLWDNPWLMDRDGSFKTYIRKLSGLQPERRRQLLDGDWDALTGQFFPELARHSHQVDWEVGPGIDWERCIDWGYNAPGVCYWAACLPDGRLYLRLEWKFQGILAADVADGIRTRTEELGRICGGPLRIRKTVVDPSMFSKTGHWGESMAETFQRRGVPCMRGDNQREQGWQRLRHWFKKAPDGVPWLVTHPSCTYFWRTVPSLVASQSNVEDVNSESDDHCGDSVRYLVMARPSPTRLADPSRTPLTGTAGELLAGVLAAQARPVLGADAVRGH